MKRYGPVENDSQVSFGDLAFPTGYVFDYERFKGHMIQSARKDGYEFISEYTINLDGHEGYCLYLSAKKGERLWITCTVPDQHLSLDFNGERRYVPAFDSLIQGTRRVVD
jgi:hypothetical protein